VVTYRSEKIQGGRLVTHRVVGETRDGYVTAGDANAFTDQQAGEPTVKQSQIVAVALQLNGNVAVIPELGTVATATRSSLTTIQYKIAGLLGTRSILGIQGFAYLLFGLSIVWYIIDAWRKRSKRQRRRDDTRSTGYSTRRIVGVFTLIIVLAATMSMIGPSGEQSIAIDSVAEDTETEGGIFAGESTNVTWNLTNSGYIPMIAFVESESSGIIVHKNRAYIPQRGFSTVKLTVTAPDDPGRYYRTLTVHRYLAILPSSLLNALYSVHPWLPILIIDALIGIPFYLFGIKLIGTGRIRNRSRSRNLSVLTRGRRLFRRLY